MKKLIVIICGLFIINGCIKNSIQENISIRVQNTTSQNFKEVIVNNKSFKSVGSAAITSYQVYESAVNLPVATLVTNNNDTLLIGALYFDYFENLKEGKYTLKIFEDTSTYYDLNCIYIKD